MRDINLLIENGIDAKKALELFGTIEKYDKIVETFCDTISDKLNQLKSYKAVSDLKQYAILAHALKSEAGFFGCSTFYELAYRHEIAGKNNDMTFINENYDILIQEIRRVTAVFGKYLGRDDIDFVPEETAQMTVLSASKKVLVIDDSENIPFLIHQVFSNRLDVILKSNLDEVKSLTDVNEIIGVILNLKAASINPIEILNFIVKNETFNKIPLCVITNNETNIKVVESLNGDVLKPPFGERDIKAKVEKFLIFHK